MMMSSRMVLSPGWCTHGPEKEIHQGRDGKGPDGEEPVQGEIDGAPGSRQVDRDDPCLPRAPRPRPRLQKEELYLELVSTASGLWCFVCYLLHSIHLYIYQTTGQLYNNIFTLFASKRQWPNLLQTVLALSKSHETYNSEWPLYFLLCFLLKSFYICLSLEMFQFGYSSYFSVEQWGLAKPCGFVQFQSLSRAIRTLGQDQEEACNADSMTAQPSYCTYTCLLISDSPQSRQWFAVGLLPDCLCNKAVAMVSAIQT